MNTATEAVEPKEETYQVYKSSLRNQRIAMPDGKLITITGGRYITKDENEIAFLDSEIENGFPYLAKSEAMTSADLDPMATLKRKIIAEYLENEQKTPQIGTVGVDTPEAPAGAVSKSQASIVSTATLGKLAAGSSSSSAGSK